MKIWILNIEHQHGADTFAYETKDEAQAHIIGYVAEWWEQERERAADSDMWGENPGGWESVRKYFDECVEGEWFSIFETDLKLSSEKPAEVKEYEKSDHVAYFYPQAWVNDQAIEVDPEGERSWVISTSHLDQIRSNHANRLEKLYYPSWVSDAVKDDPAAPQWIREWNGPFWVGVEKI